MDFVLGWDVHQRYWMRGLERKNPCCWWGIVPSTQFSSLPKTYRGPAYFLGFAGTGDAIEAVPANRLLLKGASLVGVYWGGSVMNDRAVVPKTWKVYLHIPTILLRTLETGI
jgi:hypothetical protein